MDARHTQGEWKVTREILSTSGGYINGYNVFVGNVFIGGYMGQAVDLTQPVEIKGALIAAAPKLLAALEAWVDDARNPEVGSYVDPKVWNDVKAAIAAAKGDA